MSAYKEMKGLVFDRLTVVDKDPKRHKTHCLCKCTCGNVVSVARGHLNNGHTTSCGCKAKDSPNNYKHGKLGTVEYTTWISMKSRCYNKNNQDYPDYGGRGITVCDKWKNSFENFYRDMGDRPEGLTLDRIIVDGNYEPSNCKWSTLIEQANNKTNNIRVLYLGEYTTIRSLSEMSGIPYSTVYSRHLKGFTDNELIKPLNSDRKRNKLILFKGNYYTTKQLSKLLNLSDTVILGRLQKGWNPDNLDQPVGTRNRKQSNTNNIKN